MGLFINFSAMAAMLPAVKSGVIFQLEHAKHVLNMQKMSWSFWSDLKLVTILL